MLCPLAPAAPTLRPSPSRCTLYVHVDGVRSLLFSQFLPLPHLPNPCLLLRVPCISEVVWHGCVRVCPCIVDTLCAPLLLATATAVGGDGLQMQVLNFSVESQGCNRQFAVEGEGVREVREGMLSFRPQLFATCSHSLPSPRTKVMWKDDSESSGSSSSSEAEVRCRPAASLCHQSQRSLCCGERRASGLMEPATGGGVAVLGV